MAAHMAEDGAPEGTVVVAAEQTAGRGRHGRRWSSPEGEGLYLSVILRPEIPFSQLWQTAFVASLATAEAVGQVSGLVPRIKWPNDVLLNGRKVCGILTETRRHGDTGTRRPVIVGIGVNLNNSVFPPEIADKATSIMLETGQPVSARQVEEALLTCLDRFYAAYLRDGFTSILAQWKTLDCTSGRRVSVVTGGGIVEGTAQEVDPNGDLIVLRDDGTTARVTAGEVILRDG
jgi:BirA family transcriptional regulator, biotin operon repressor / biotin---[acetyl-CoA-carboxylase] ligase